ncbi:PAS domain-containing sensor histidine kinase [Ochrobactrum sp. Marseille-Q0166]|uniref:PAS domain-containing sensor histidine kinase n=1 Tax=Ochrobactrum sp. Marseille-Q0166 TaxID=2761105 RepID=UPI001655B80E|nr:PAS domain-containing sensor histidine kinase [Ochrobactrum sp. Marseille-Q0166]MBC8719292.1 histidine kinase [Ochrobactrum sp. Marseille-Q0166]
MDKKFSFLHAEGRSVDEIKAVDWSRTPLGDPANWRPTLKTAVQMMLSSHFPKAICWGANYITLFNDAFRPILGKKAGCMGKPFSEIWAEAWSDISTIADKAYGGEATFIEDFPLVIDRYGFPEQCYFTFCYSPIRDDDGSVGGFMDTVVESTGKVEAEKNAAVFNAELAHRIKNNFSIINSIASQTFVHSDPEDLRVFAERIRALSNAHDVLRLGKHSNGHIKQLIAGTLAALAIESRVKVDGPDILIGPKGGSALSLLVHELSTNAIKYGALSNNIGSVSIEISSDLVDGIETLAFRWSEFGGPLVVQPDRKGFGSKLIRMGLSGGGVAKLDFLPTGVVAEFTAPLVSLMEENRHLHDSYDKRIHNPLSQSKYNHR